LDLHVRAVTKHELAAVEEYLGTRYWAPPFGEEAPVLLRRRNECRTCRRAANLYSYRLHRDWQRAMVVYL